jgi:hypothetical protein
VPAVAAAPAPARSAQPQRGSAAIAGPPAARARRRREKMARKKGPRAPATAALRSLQSAAAAVSGPCGRPRQRLRPHGASGGALAPAAAQGPTVSVARGRELRPTALLRPRQAATRHAQRPRLRPRRGTRRRGGRRRGRRRRGRRGKRLAGRQRKQADWRPAVAAAVNMRTQRRCGHPSESSGSSSCAAAHTGGAGEARRLGRRMRRQRASPCQTKARMGRAQGRQSRK